MYGGVHNVLSPGSWKAHSHTSDAHARVHTPAGTRILTGNCGLTALAFLPAWVGDREELTRPCKLISLRHEKRRQISHDFDFIVSYVWQRHVPCLSQTGNRVNNHSRRRMPRGRNLSIGMVGQTVPGIYFEIPVKLRTSGRRCVPGEAPAGTNANVVFIRSSKSYSSYFRRA